MRRVNRHQRKTIKRLNIPKVVTKADIKQQGEDWKPKRAAVDRATEWGPPGSAGGLGCSSDKGMGPRRPSPCKC